MELPTEAVLNIAGFVGRGDRMSEFREYCNLQQTCTSIHDICCEEVYGNKQWYGKLCSEINFLAMLEEIYRNSRWIMGKPWPRYNNKYAKIKNR